MSRWAPLVIAAVIVSAGTLAWLLRSGGHRTGSMNEPGDPLERRLDAMAPGAAYDSALALAKRGRTEQSLPYYRRALRGVREDFWQLHCNYASALYNLTIQIAQRRRGETMRTRSSIERAELLREAIVHSDVATHLARSPHERAIVIGLSGQLAHVYGLPWEAFVAYREAQFADPSDPTLASRANRFQWSLEHPTAANPAEPDTAARIQ